MADTNNLRFFDTDHIYTLDGERLPCVSDLCRFLHREIYKDAPPWQMEAAADRGTKVHAATEILDKMGRAEIDGEFSSYLEAYAQFLQEHDVLWELIEHSSYHPAHKYAGTIDRYGLVDGEKVLLDIKTTYTIYKPLCSASLNLYRLMLEARGWAVEAMLILHLKKDGNYKLVRIPFDDTVPTALITLNNALSKRRRTKKNDRRTETE